MIIKNNYLPSFLVLLLTSGSYADGFDKKEVYSYQSNTGTPVFTDKRPIKSKQYKTQTIEATTSNDNGNNSRKNNSSNTVINYNNSTLINQTQTIVYANKNSSKKKQHSKKQRTGKHSLKKCQNYKKKFDHYSEKMSEGYTNSEYKKLEKNRKKYRNLLFNNCDTKTFSE